MKKKSSVPPAPSLKKRPVIEIHIPSSIIIELVQGNELRHYEIFSSLFAVMLSVATGFWTARFLSGPNGSITGSALVFTIISILFLIAAIYYRSKVYNGSIKRTASFDDFES